MTLLEQHRLLEVNDRVVRSSRSPCRGLAPCDTYNRPAICHVAVLHNARSGYHALLDALLLNTATLARCSARLRMDCGIAQPVATGAALLPPAGSGRLHVQLTVLH